MQLWLYGKQNIADGWMDGRRNRRTDGQLDRDLHVQFVSREAVGQELGAAVVLVWYFGLKGLVQFPPHWAHTGPKTTFLFEFVTLRKTKTADTLVTQRWTLEVLERNRPLSDSFFLVSLGVFMDRILKLLSHFLP